jgi:C_GCAxxG_C_C family probable redox protein
MDRVALALSLHENGFNCSQAVFATFSEALSIDQKTALRIATCFGGGMRMGEVCGALTGALMAIGMHDGHDIEGDLEEKQRVNDMTAVFVQKFMARQGAVRCQDILDGYNSSIPKEREIIESKALFETKCPLAIERAVKMVEEALELS